MINVIAFLSHPGIKFFLPEINTNKNVLEINLIIFFKKWNEIELKFYRIIVIKMSIVKL